MKSIKVIKELYSNRNHQIIAEKRTRAVETIEKAAEETTMSIQTMKTVGEIKYVLFDATEFDVYMADEARTFAEANGYHVFYNCDKDGYKQGALYGWTSMATWEIKWTK